MVESTMDGVVIGEKVRKAFILKPTRHFGYCVVGLTCCGKTSQVRVHRLVAEAFLSHDQEKTEVHHIDHDRGNNDVSNLKWVAPEEHEQYHKARKRTYKYSTANTKRDIA